MSTDGFYNLPVAEVRRETPDTLSVCFEVPENLKSTFQYKAGQYLTLRAEIGGEEVRRAYSMSSAPNEQQLCVTVKRVQGGRMSNFLHDTLKAGDTLEVLAPEGRFVLNPAVDNRASYYLIGAGSGITPLFSILKTVLEEEPQSEVHLLYGSRSEEHIIFREELDKLARRYEGQLRVVHVLSQPSREKSGGLTGLFGKSKTRWSGFQGRIDGKILSEFLQAQPARNKTSVYYLCGPGTMIEICEATLLHLGADKKSVHREFFTAPDAASAGSNGSPETAGVATAFEATLNGQTHQVSLKPGQTLLDAMLALGLNAPYSCTSGACSTCMAKVLEGSVRMDACFALDEEELEDGYILSCQSHPSSATLRISFDA
jgi:ring-1,2-phenylacetyl-CoA epoxidase subunit PaaE